MDDTTMKIEITTDAGPWVDGAHRGKGWTGDVDKETADILIDRAWATAKDTAKPKRRPKEDDAE